MKIRDIIDFTNEHGNGKVFKGWTEEEIAVHLTFQANDGTLMVTESGGEITSFSTYKQIKNFDGDIEKVFGNPPIEPVMIFTSMSLCQSTAPQLITCSRCLRDLVQMQIG